ncbi:uncharacterized protein LOC110676839 [Aedes aegypti]|uniref:DUF4780 domain-containing protein n=1 Tax=Aedes aegypti TaxID=7159 RepID=A0A6I8U3K1_AEDAE|nr:uncharacterized protein LOC110674611 [Aedes aegypti]XP_021701908.1 uncharacterized protein LOC110676839 [Aedes aegypti]
MSDIDFETEYRLLMSPANASSASKDSAKRAANSPASSEAKKSHVENTDLKLAFKRKNAEVDQQFFEAVCSALSDIQSDIPSDVTYPGFYGSGFKMGIGWFYARDDESMLWLKSALKRIVEKRIIPDLEVLPYTKISPLRRVVFSVPTIPRLGKDAKSSVLRNIARLNPNLCTNYWRVLRVLPPQGGRHTIIMEIDEGSVSAIESQRCKVFYAFSQVFLSITAKNDTA